MDKLFLLLLIRLSSSDETKKNKACKTGSRNFCIVNGCIALSAQIFFHYLPKPRTDFYVRLMDGMSRIFSITYVMTGNHIHFISVATL